MRPGSSVVEQEPFKLLVLGSNPSRVTFKKSSPSGWIFLDLADDRILTKSLIFESTRKQDLRAKQEVTLFGSAFSERKECVLFGNFVLKNWVYCRVTNRNVGKKPRISFAAKTNSTCTYSRIMYCEI